VSPRSEEFMTIARDAPLAARATLDAEVPTRPVSDAYYAMLSAARAALSEEDRYARPIVAVGSCSASCSSRSGRLDEAVVAAVSGLLA
jgi:uncharacterized protein (UPF0332 family)